MNRISGPAGLPQSCAEIVTPSGALIVNDLYFFSCAVAGAVAATSSNAKPTADVRRRENADIMVWSSLTHLVFAHQLEARADPRRASSVRFFALGPRCRCPSVMLKQ